jgi:hypothetical protein
LGRSLPKVFSHQQIIGKFTSSNKSLNETNNKFANEISKFFGEHGLVGQYTAKITSKNIT